jgi:hypothetical protein
VSAPQAPFVHFSVDDVLKALIEATDQALPLFEHPFFAFLQGLHRRFETRVDLYLFERAVIDGRERTLAEVSDRFRPALQEADWIRFGPHAREGALAPYQQSPEEQVATFASIYAQIDRFAGPGRRSAWVRLHYFSEAYAAGPFLRQAGVEALLLTDKDACAYHLPEPLKAELKREGRIAHAELQLARSHHRVENLLAAADPDVLQAALDGPLRDHGYLSLFTHEYELDRPEVRARTEECLAYLASRAIPST